MLIHILIFVFLCSVLTHLCSKYAFYIYFFIVSLILYIEEFPFFLTFVANSFCNFWMQARYVRVKIGAILYASLPMFSQQGILVYKLPQGEMPVTENSGVPQEPNHTFLIFHFYECSHSNVNNVYI